METRMLFAIQRRQLVATIQIFEERRASKIFKPGYFLKYPGWFVLLCSLAGEGVF